MEKLSTESTKSDVTNGSSSREVYSEFVKHAGGLNTIISLGVFVVGAIISIAWAEFTVFQQGKEIAALEESRKVLEEKLSMLAAYNFPSTSSSQQIAELQQELIDIKAAQQHAPPAATDILARLDTFERRLKTLENSTAFSRQGAAPTTGLTSAPAANIAEKCNSRDQWNILKACLRNCLRDENSIACTVTLTNTGTEKYFHFGKSDDRSAPPAVIHTGGGNGYNAAFVYVGDKKANSGVTIIDNFSASVTYSFDVPSRNEEHIEIMEIPMWFAPAPAMQPVDMPIRVSDIGIAG